jgi:hypothetical protein
MGYPSYGMTILFRMREPNEAARLAELPNSEK